MNELLLDKIRFAQMAKLDTGELIGRLTSIEDPSLQTTAEGEEITDAVGATITTIYRSKKAKFTGTNSLISLDLLAMQYGTEKQEASSSAKIATPYSEIVEAVDVSGTPTLTLKYVPKGDIKFIYKMNNRDFATTYTQAAAVAEGKFVLDAENKKITLNAGETGKFFVTYEYDASVATKVDNRTSNFPTSVALTVFAYFRDPCDDNIKYSGVIVTNKAKINPESIELALTSTGKHPFEFNIEQDYCDETNDSLFSIIITSD